MKRRNFIEKTSMVTGAVLLGASLIDVNAETSSKFISKRPPIEKRTFVSKAVEDKIKEVRKAIKDEELAWMFENCFPNTLDTTIKHHGILDRQLDTFIITGDIYAMWLRDSTAQVWPMMTLINSDPKLKDLVKGLINRQVKCVNIDPYANAFNFDANVEDKGHQKDDTTMKPELHERKWEIDSLCYVIRLSHGYWKLTGDITLFNDNWEKAMRAIVRTFKEQQRKDGKGPYRFRRTTNSPIDTAGFDGFGNKVNPVGLICSLFRPSDDGTIFPFLIPSNLFAVQSLRQLNELYIATGKDAAFASECIALANEVEAAVAKYGIIEHEVFGKIYAYEVDGFGSRLCMDDANVPSLLSLPYLDSINLSDPLYIATRKYALSTYNPWFLKGKAAEGIGGPHTGDANIWPMSIIIRAMTSNDREEIKQCLKMVKATHNGTGFIHESFYYNDAQYFSRSWFAWANTLFGELIVKVYNQDRDILSAI